MTDTLPPRAPADEEAIERIELNERLAAIERENERYRVSRDSWTFVLFGIVAVVALLSVVVLVIALDNDGDGGDGSGVAAPPIQAELSEFEIVLSTGQVEAGGVIEITNAGTMIHDLAIRGTDLATPEIDPGGTASLDISSLAPGTYEVYCTIPGHADSGMSTTLVIGAGGDGAAAAGDHSEHAMTPEEAAAMDAVMVNSVLEFPAETEGTGNQPLEPEVLADGTLRFELTASIVDWEVAPGEIVQAWAYNGMVPGPRIDVEVGDTVELELTNELPLGTDIHWHGIDVPFDQDGVAPITQDLVTNGETFTYRFTTTEPAIGMYHAHAHGHEAVPNGLFGTFYVGQVDDVAGRTISGIEVPADLVIAQDIPMVVNDAGVIGLTINGKSFPATEPVVVDAGDWIRVTYFNEGLQVHPMHLHGFEQLVVAKDGEPLDAPYAADTILVSPGERYTVLVHAELEGTWVWHCHILNHVESDQGMFGMVTALVVQ